MDPWWFGKTLSGATLGIVGMGDIGSRVANKASAAFNMRVHYYSQSRKSEEVEAQAGGAKYFPDLLELCSSSDVIVATVALTPATIGLIGKKEFEVMKSGSLSCSHHLCRCCSHFSGRASNRCSLHQHRARWSYRHLREFPAGQLLFVTVDVQAVRQLTCVSLWSSSLLLSLLFTGPGAGRSAPRKSNRMRSA